MRLTICLLVFKVFFALIATSQVHTWKPLTNVRAYTMKVNPLNKNTIYVGNASNRILRSYDAGKTWDTLLIGDIGTDSHLTTFHICRNDTNVLIVGGFVHTGLRRSVDGGKTWTFALIDSAIRQIWFVSEALVEDPITPDILYAARSTVVNEVYRSKDCGATWEVMGEVAKTITKKLHTIAIRPDSTNILFTGCQQGVIARSDDSGRTWREVPTNVDYTADAEIPKITFSKSNPNIGYAIVTISDPDHVDGNGGTLRTTDGGASWTRIAHEDTSLWAVEVHPVSGREDIWVGGFRTFTLPTVIKGDSIVRRSTDGGITWLNYDDVPWQLNDEDRVVSNIWVIRYDTLSKKIYLCTESGLYVLEEPVSVDEHIASANASVVTCEVVGTELLVRSRDALIERLEFYSVLGTPSSASANVRAMSYSISATRLPNGILFVVAHLANGESRVCPVLIGGR